MNFKRMQQMAARVFEPDGRGGVRRRYDEADARRLNPVILAYVGDAYFHLFVRTRLLFYEQSKVQLLNRFSARIVSAVWQARAYAEIEPMLTEEEQGIFRRGRNAHSHAPRAASPKEYRMSTGFEALLGALYLSGERERLREIAEAAFQAAAAAISRGENGAQSAPGRMVEGEDTEEL